MDLENIGKEVKRDKSAKSDGRPKEKYLTHVLPPEWRIMPPENTPVFRWDNS